MGIIARQSSKKSLVSFLGVLIGAISIIFIYPLDKETYGLALFLFSSASLLMIFLSAGSLSLIIKYFPVFERKKIKGFFLLMISIVFLVVVLMTIILAFFWNYFEHVLGLLGFDLLLINKYLFSIYFLTLLFIGCYFMIFQASNYRRIVVPAILHELSYKIILPVLILLVFVNAISTEIFVSSYLIFFLLVFILLGTYLYYLGAFKMERFETAKIIKPLKLEMASYLLFSGLNQVGATIVSRIDTIMVATLISLSDTGIYGIFLFMANVIEVPIRSINQIAGPIISASLEDNDHKNVNSIYTKSSLNSLLSGIFIFLVVWGLLNNIFDLMPENDSISEYKNVFLFLAIGKLVDMGFSTNSHILIYSKYYKYNLIFVLILGLLNLVLNYFLIKEFGIVGAAIATASSLAFYNIVKLFFIKLKMGFWPFSLETIKIIIIGLLIFFGISFLPDFFMDWPDILVKGLLISITFYILLKLFKVRADIILEGEKLALLYFNKFFRKR